VALEKCALSVRRLARSAAEQIQRLILGSFEIGARAKFCSHGLSVRALQQSTVFGRL
jgi:hypothetical protein